MLILLTWQCALSLHHGQDLLHVQTEPAAAAAAADVLLSSDTGFALHGCHVAKS